MLREGASGYCLGSSRSWELPGFVSLSWQRLGQNGGGEKGGLVADLGNRKILQSTDGHSAWSSAAPRKPAVGLGQLKKADGERGTLRGRGDSCGLKGKKV